MYVVKSIIHCMYDKGFHYKGSEGPAGLAAPGDHGAIVAQRSKGVLCRLEARRTTIAMRIVVILGRTERIPITRKRKRTINTIRTIRRTIT